ncbi:MAG TPA: alpha-ketoacid dehydrogenase subunit beta [Desulfitobacteriaceae bacterium]|nr:alpha-ketoacid dehydrogenase subunit beta [Desulfitobacteriaceae bacterium]
MSKKTYMEAIREGIYEEMKKDSRLFMIGEDVGPYGGEMGLSKGLWEAFGDERVRDFPIAESLILGAGLGASLVGARAIAEIPFCDFMGMCMDQLYNQAAKMHYMFGGQAKIPLLIRTPIGGYQGGAEQHSQCLEAWFAHIPGLKVVMPSNAYDAKGLLMTSLKDNNPVMFIEHKKLYQIADEVPDNYYEVPFGKANVIQEGSDVTVIATSYMVYLCKKALTGLEEEGINAELIDPRTLVPFDEECLLESIKKTGRLVIVQEAWRRCSFASEIASVAAEKGFRFLKEPVKIVAAQNVPIPFSPVLENFVLPSPEKIRKAVLDVMRR